MNYNSENGYSMIDFMADIEFDNFSLEMLEFDFFIKVMESSSLLFIPVMTNSSLPVYDLKIGNHLIMRLYV